LKAFLGLGLERVVRRKSLLKYDWNKSKQVADDILTVVLGFLEKTV
jgi:hypothetical protein